MGLEAIKSELLTTGASLVAIKKAMLYNAIPVNPRNPIISHSLPLGRRPPLSNQNIRGINNNVAKKNLKKATVLGSRS